MKDFFGAILMIVLTLGIVALLVPIVVKQWTDMLEDIKYRKDHSK